MPTRNTAVLTQIVESLGDLVLSAPHALAKLEWHFKDQLLIVAGDVNDVERHAEKLRLAITTPEAGLVLDHIGGTSVVAITIENGL
jgi:hypothetical protein